MLSPLGALLLGVHLDGASRRLGGACRVALALVVLFAGSRADGQEHARRAVPAGEVSGLEMSIEGALHAVPGGRLVWMVTVYEVVRRRDLRPASNVALSVTAPFAPETPLATARTDAGGRAELAMDLPEEFETTPSLMVEAISPRNVRRTFDAAIEVLPAHRVELFVDRDRAPPGGTVLAFGRVRDARDSAPLRDVEVRLAETFEGPLLRAPRTLRTDASGAFAAVVELPDPPRERQELTGRVAITATTDEGSATAEVVVGEIALDPVWVRAMPERALVAPGDTIRVDVEVRDASGVPIAGARVDWSDAPTPDDRPIRTNARGRARLAWEIDRGAVAGAWQDLERDVRIVHARHGTGGGRARVRAARRAWIATSSVEGGALVPGLPGRIYARVIEADGTVHAGRSVSLESARFRASNAAAPGAVPTDADGIAVFDVVLDARSASDECDGPTRAAAVLVVDGTREDVCVPVDPDATLAVHAEQSSAGGAIDVQIHRRADVARSPVVVTALVEREGRWIPIARATVAPGTRTVALPSPDRAPGAVWVRARPVVADGQEVRGGGTLLWLGAREPLAAWSVSDEGATASSISNAGTHAVFAVDPERAASFRAALTATLGPLGAAVAEGRGQPYVEALAASRVPADAAAAAVLRDGRMEPEPLPDDAVALGLLRDPWRTRARFVRGRLGAMMRAVEDYVDARVPDELDEVAVRDARAWRFNREVLEAALGEAGLGDERAAALDGEPLDIDALTTLDPAFTYDRVARRITRIRLFRLLGFLREMVRERQLDFPWARRGDPSHYPISLIESDVAWSDVAPERSHLFDGWGRPFLLLPVRGSARFTFLQPVAGYELISAGPDGRPRTGDDLVDPFARILPSGSVYAEAVGEDALIARVGSVALGRATVESLAEAFQIEATGWEPHESGEESASWEGTPPPLDSAPRAPAPVPLIASHLGDVRTHAAGEAASVVWRLPRERRPYVALALDFRTDGSVGWSERPFEAGAPVAARFEPPVVMRPGERLRVPLTVVHLVEGATARVRVGTTGAITAAVEDDAIAITARALGNASLTLYVEPRGAPAWTATHRIRVLPEGALRATHSGAIAAPEATVELRVPDGARPWRGRVVIGVPQAVRHDPLFDEDALPRAAVVAWADVISGRAPDPEHVAALERASPSDALALSTACALTVWSAQPEPRSSFIAGARERLAAELPADLGARAAVLAALAPAAPAIVDEHASDPVAAVIARLREDAWRALATERDRPAVMARMAAALLLADDRDTVGRALLERARAALPGSPEEGFDEATPDAYVGTLALAIAARQTGDDALADALAPAILGRFYLAPRLGTEAIFWVLAASAYGALGAATPRAVEVEIDGASRQVGLENGVAVLPVSPGASVRVETSERSRVWVRAESRVVATSSPRDDAPMVPRFEGDVGRVGERAALELLLESTDDEGVTAPIVEVALPSSGVLDRRGRAEVEVTSVVERVEGPDRAGVVRLHLAPLRARGTHRFAFPIRWLASGSVRGLSLVAYDRERPWAQTVRANRVVTVEAP